jgi:hypothetical protein
MKTCLSFRSMLLTDYIDGELDRDAKRIIEEHLTVCPECKRLVAMVKEDISIISDEGMRKRVPAYVWQSIVKEMGGEERKTNPVINFISSFTERLIPPRLTPALVGMILLVLSVSSFLYTQYIKQEYENTHFEYVAELFTNASSSVISEHEGLGTLIEEYFL